MAHTRTNRARQGLAFLFNPSSVGLGFRVSGLGFRVKGLGPFRVLANSHSDGLEAGFRACRSPQGLSFVSCVERLGQRPGVAKASSEFRGISRASRFLSRPARGLPDGSEGWGYRAFGARQVSWIHGPVGGP